MLLDVEPAPDFGREHCGGGLLFQQRIGALEELGPFISRRDQTMTHFGFEASDSADFAVRLNGLDDCARGAGTELQSLLGRVRSAAGVDPPCQHRLSRDRGSAASKRLHSKNSTGGGGLLYAMAVYAGTRQRGALPGFSAASS